MIPSTQNKKGTVPVTKLTICAFSSANLDSIADSHREKRQLENFDDEYPSASQQEEEDPGFWDRIVKVALKLFSKFIEWLNSS